MGVICKRTGAPLQLTALGFETVGAGDSERETGVSKTKEIKDSTYL